MTARKAKRRESAYLTKRTTANAARRGFAIAARETVEIMGFNVVAKDGWIVKVDEQGNIIERISKIPGYNKNLKLHLD